MVPNLRRMNSPYNMVMAATANHTLEIRKNGVVVGLLDDPVEINGGPEVRFDRIVVVGNLSEEVEYEGRRLYVQSAEDFVGLEITRTGHVEGPVWHGVVCRVLSS